MNSDSNSIDAAVSRAVSVTLFPHLIRCTGKDNVLRAVTKERSTPQKRYCPHQHDRRKANLLTANPAWNALELHRMRTRNGEC